MMHTIVIQEHPNRLPPAPSLLKILHKKNTIIVVGVNNNAISYARLEKQAYNIYAPYYYENL